MKLSHAILVHNLFDINLTEFFLKICSAAKELKKTQKATAKKAAPAAAPKKQAKAAQKAQKPMQKAAPRVGGKR